MAYLFMSERELRSGSIWAGPNTDRRTFITTTFALAFAILLGAATRSASGLNIVLNFNSAQSDSPTFDPTGSQLTAMLQAAESYWQDIIEDSHTLTINYWWEDLSDADGTLGQHTLISQSGGRETEANVRLDTQTGGVNRLWYFDSTPTDDSEFAMEQTLWRDLTATQKANWFNGTGPEVLEIGYRGDATTSAPAAARNGYDALSTVIHEIGHALGMSGSNDSTIAETSDQDYDAPAALIDGISLGIVVEAADDIAHIEDNVALMCGGCGGTGFRRRASATDVLAMSSTSNWSDIDLPRKDFLSGAGWNSPGNWEGNAVPGTADDTFIRLQDTTVNVSLTSAGFAANLLIQAGNTLSTGANKLDIAQTTTLDGAGATTTTRIFVYGDGEFETNDLSLLSGNLSPRGGLVDVQQNATVDADSSIDGYGTVSVQSSLNNNGTVRATSSIYDLTFTSPGAGVWDLDGTSGNGVVLADLGDMNFTGTLNDAFDGNMIVGSGRTIRFNNGWELGSGGVLELNGGTVAGTATTIRGDVNVAQTAIIATSTTFESSADVFLTNSDDKLRLTGVTVYRGGNYTGSGVLEQTGNATIEENTTIAVATLDWDGSSGGSETIINPGKTLTINSHQIDLLPTSDGFDGTVSVNGGTLVVNTTGSWRLDGILNLAVGGGYPQVQGSPISVHGQILATGNSSTIYSDLDFESSSRVIVAAANDLLSFRGVTTYRGGSYTGLGTIRQSGPAVIAEDTIINVAIYDWDGSIAGAGSTVVNAGAKFTINSTVIDQSGDGYDGDITVANTAQLTVNTVAAWTLDADGSLTLGGATAEVRGSDIINQGTIRGAGRVATDLNNQGTVSPGKSPGVINILGNYAQTDAGRLQIELGGNTPGIEYDVLQITGWAKLNGLLDVSLISRGGGTFSPSLSDTFEILIAAGGRAGAFAAQSLPALDGFLDWTVAYQADSVWLAVVPALSGDYNVNGVVDAADYVVWRSTLGETGLGIAADGNQDGLVSQADYTFWRSRFGQTASSAASANLEIPEPMVAGVLIIWVAFQSVRWGSSVRRFNTK